VFPWYGAYPYFYLFNVTNNGTNNITPNLIDYNVLSYSEADIVNAHIVTNGKYRETNKQTNKQTQTNTNKQTTNSSTK
jgi:hypothetical protein